MRNPIVIFVIGSGAVAGRVRVFLALGRVAVFLMSHTARKHSSKLRLIERSLCKVNTRDDDAFMYVTPHCSSNDILRG